jgi:hypothetical protein
MTKKLYFSLPKLVTDTIITADSKNRSIQLYNFPENPLNGSVGFKQFKLLESKDGRSSSLNKILNSVR